MRLTIQQSATRTKPTGLDDPKEQETAGVHNDSDDQMTGVQGGRTTGVQNTMERVKDMRMLWLLQPGETGFDNENDKQREQ